MSSVLNVLQKDRIIAKEIDCPGPGSYYGNSFITVCPYICYSYWVVGFCRQSNLLTSFKSLAQGKKRKPWSRLY